MNKSEFAKALARAKEHKKVPEKADIEIFMGFGLEDFKPVDVTIEQVAKLINYIALKRTGEYENIVLGDVEKYGKKFNIKEGK